MVVDVVGLYGNRFSNVSCRLGETAQVAGVQPRDLRTASDLSAQRIHYVQPPFAAHCLVDVLHCVDAYWPVYPPANISLAP